MGKIAQKQISLTTLLMNGCDNEGVIKFGDVH